MHLYRYSRWDGTQELEPFTAEDLMEHLADSILDERDLSSAIREMLQRGAEFQSGRRMPGLRDLLERLRERRQEQLGRYNMGSVLDDIREQLDQVIDLERQGIQRRLSPPGGDSLSATEGEAPTDVNADFQKMLEQMAQRHMDQLDQLPPDVGGRIQELREYDFMEPEAREKFEELLDTLRKQILENYFQGMKQALGAVTPEQMAQMKEMLRDLNELMDQHRQGDDSGFQDFMEKWGQFFPDGIKNVDQLAQHLNQQMAAMRSLMESMTPEMRRELEQMAGALFQDEGLNEELSELMWNLRRKFPNPQGEDFPFAGDEPVSLQEAMRLMRDMHELDDLERELVDAVRQNDATRLDPDQIGRLIDQEAQQMAQELRDFIRMLEEAGFITRKGKEWALTPRAMKKIGERALEDIFGHIDRGLSGDHTLTRFGWGIERLDETKTYTFGDPFAVDAQGTIMNALRRDAGAGGRGPGHSGLDTGPQPLAPSPRSRLPVSLELEDFEVWRSASIDQCSTVIMLDMSYSMLNRGRFQAGRKVALALDSLIRSKFPRDTLHVVAFSYFVLPLEPWQLLDDYWIDPRGTDIPEALRQARQILGKRKGGTKQIIMITDGEPHANSTGWGWSGMTDGGWSMRQAMDDTLREVSQCTKEGITVNTFMLDSQPVITTFIKAMTKINSGRIFFADPSKLGEYLIVDYVKNRRRAE